VSEKLHTGGEKKSERALWHGSEENERLGPSGNGKTPGARAERTGAVERVPGREENQRPAARGKSETGGLHSRAENEPDRRSKSKQERKIHRGQDLPAAYPKNEVIRLKHE
jgi:hypothetical protein